jgi:hypothetical protein
MLATRSGFHVYYALRLRCLEYSPDRGLFAAPLSGSTNIVDWSKLKRPWLLTQAFSYACSPTLYVLLQTLHSGWEFHLYGCNK